MAVTSMWAIRGHINTTINYIQNAEKTIEGVVDYTTNEDKTNTKQYVTYINCDCFDPNASMMQTKKMFHDESEIVAYHGYQSFKDGEVDADIAHEIGVKLANRLFAGRYEVIVATHLDKHHLHNHILINSTSFIDGKRFCNTKRDYRELRSVSDELCREYGLSIIKSSNKTKYHNNFNHMRSYINDLKNDMDDLIGCCVRNSELFDYLRLKGYEYEYRNRENIFYHPYCKTPIYLKELGEKYQLGALSTRMMENYCRNNNSQIINNHKKLKQYYKDYTNKRICGLNICYINRFIRLRVLPKKKSKLSDEARKDLYILKMITKEMDIIAKYNIDNIEQLNDYQNTVRQQLDNLLKQRQKFYNCRQRTSNVEEKEKWSLLSKRLTPDIKELRFEIKACEDIKRRSLENEIKEIQKIKQREEYVR